MILVLVDPLDATATDPVLRLLYRRGIEHLRLQLSEFPESLGATLTYSGVNQGTRLRLGEEYLDLASVRSVWDRSSLSPGISRGNRVIGNSAAELTPRASSH